jgi:hypothetical protein
MKTLIQRFMRSSCVLAVAISIAMVGACYLVFVMATDIPTVYAVDEEHILGVVSADGTRLATVLPEGRYNTVWTSPEVWAQQESGGQK